MKRPTVLMTLMLALACVTNARASLITLSFSGTIDRVVDANAEGEPTIDFTPIPAGSLFSGNLTYDSWAPQTGGGTGYAFFNDLAPGSATATINGFTFTILAPGFGNPALQVNSLEAGFGSSGVFIGTQPITLPVGWSMEWPALPYFTLQFFDDPAQNRSLALPTVAGDFPLGTDRLILDFDQSVTVDGQTFGDRVFVIGTIDSFALTAGSPTAVPEVGNLTLVLVGLATLIVRRQSTGRPA